MQQYFPIVSAVLSHNISAHLAHAYAVSITYSSKINIIFIKRNAHIRTAQSQKPSELSACKAELAQFDYRRPSAFRIAFYIYLLIET